MWNTIAAAAAVILLVAFIVVASWRGWRWTGFKGKSLWDWLKLLIIPGGLAVVVFLLNASQSHRSDQVEADRLEATVLNEYFQQMSDLMLNRKLTAATGEDDPVAQMATALTLSALGRLNHRRKALVLQFVDRANLISADHSPVDLDGVDFHEIDASRLRFTHRMVLEDVDLTGADFSKAAIGGAAKPSYLSGRFGDAKFQDAWLKVTFKAGTNLRGARFSNTHFIGSAPPGCLAGVVYERMPVGWRPPTGCDG